MEEGSGRVEAGAVGMGGMEDKGEEAAAAQAMVRAYLGNLGPAMEDEGVDLFDPKHPFVTYSHFHWPGEATPYTCNTDGSPMYQATFQATPPNILPHLTHSCYVTVGTFTRCG